jgi:hypothetical protein
VHTQQLDVGANQQVGTSALQRQGIKNPTVQQVEAVLRATYDVK